MNSGALIERGVSEVRKGNHSKGLACFDRALLAEPDHVEALNNRGSALGLLGRLPEALTCFDRVLELDPKHIEALHNRGLALGMLGRHAAAVDCLQRLLAIEAHHVPALCSLGYSLLELDRHEDALRHLEQALRLEPAHAGARRNRGVALGNLGRHEEALACFAAILAANPSDEALSEEGSALVAAGRYEEALSCFKQVLACAADDGDALQDAAASLVALGEYSEAEALLDKALARDPAHIGALLTRAVVLHRQNLWQEALECCERVLSLDPSQAEARNYRGAALLRLGKLNDGFRDMEARWRTARLRNQRLRTDAPLWLGEANLAGRTILLHAEQGLGDTLQFVRYAPLVAARGARVVLRVPQPLCAILRTLTPPPVIVGDHVELPPHDFHCPLMSLPLAFGTTLETIPARIPYLHAEHGQTAAWGRRLGEPARPRIGLVWAGGQAFEGTRLRDIPLQALQTVLSADADFIGLQKEVAEADRDLLQRLPMLRFGEALGDFADTAALIENLDLVISVDTAVAHLAGALGKPVWILNRFCACWRWLDQRADSPWYPTARLFRQKSAGDWQGVVEEVRQALEDFLESRRAELAPPVPAHNRSGDIVRTLLRSGVESARAGNYEAALAAFTRALELDPRNVPALCSMGTALLDLGSCAEAEDYLNQALTLDPQHAGAHFQRGLVRLQLGDEAAAAECFSRVLAVMPHHRGALRNRGLCLGRLGRMEEALACFDGLLASDAGDLEALVNRGSALAGLRRFAEARACFDRVLAAAPDYADAQLARSLLSISEGRLSDGCREFESRWRTERYRHLQLKTAAPLWLGAEAVGGRRVLLHCEQGLGDSIQFARYAPLLAQRGAQVTLRVPAVLRELMQTLPGEVAVVTEAGPLPAHDLHCPLMSLPLAFGTSLETIPGQVPYLRSGAARSAAWAARLGPRRRPRIGLAWAGRQRPPKIPPRDLALRLLQPLLELDAEFISLQQEVPESDRALLERLPLVRHGEALADFADTAALIDNLDLVISVDTAVAHLAGALGKPVWVMNRYAGCWRWMWDRSDSPWYPSLRLFRQPAPGDWAAVVAVVRQEAEQWLGALAPAADAEVERWLQQGIAAVGHEDYASALECFTQVLQRQPRNTEALWRLGAALVRTEYHEEALRCFDQVLAIAPAHAEANFYRGFVLWYLGEERTALECYDAVLQVLPDHFGALFNSGLALGRLGRFEKALERFDRILRDRPQHTDALTNRAIALASLGRLDEALSSFDEVLLQQPEHALARHRRSWIYLARGRLAEGFREFEYRWREIEGYQYRLKELPLKHNRLQSQAPRWDGQRDLDGETILLYAEQGLGDTLQFVRYVPMVAALGAKLVLRAPLPLLPLLASLAGDIQLLREDAELPPHDCQCPLLSLPLAFGTTLETIPAQVPYLRTEASRVARWRQRLGERTRPRIGLVWAGHRLWPNHPRDIALDLLRPLLALDADFVSLQKEIPEADAALLETLPIARHGETLEDFADTAALVENLDLVVTVDTAVAHLAGAMAKPVWIMNHYACCWRYLLGRSDSPWYPSARLFRQKAPGGWPEVVESVRQALAAHLAQAAGPAAPDADVSALVQGAYAAAAAKDYSRALEHLDRALACAPARVDLLSDYGSVLGMMGRSREALAYFDQALALEPGRVGTLCNRGLALGILDRHEEAVADLRQVLKQQPASVDGMCVLAYSLRSLGHLEEALGCLKSALEIEPAHPGALANCGLTLAALNRPEEALPCFKRLRDLKPEPGNLGALANAGGGLYELGRYDDALALLERALDLDPGCAEARFNRGSVRMMLGDFGGGLRDLEARWRTDKLAHARFDTDAPQWHGEAGIHGKRVLLHHEQGLGDSLQFLRYAPLLAQQGAHVLLQVPQALRPIAASLKAVHGAVEVLDCDRPPPHDLHCPLMSLPLAFGTTLATIPAQVPYLYCPAQRSAHWRRLLGAGRRPRIGLAWAGRQSPLIARRDVPLRLLRPLLELDADFVSLQKQVPERDAALLQSLPIMSHGESLEDFADAAALIDNLDLVIAADTAIAHLTGALGKPVWIMNRYAGCWRWLRDRSDSPWYPTARLFRQRAMGDWQGVVQDVLASGQAFLRTLRPVAAPRAPALAAESADALVLQGVALSGRSQHGAALSCFEQALELQPNHVAAAVNCGVALINLGRLPEALERLARIPEGHPAYADAQCNASEALRRLGRHDEALACAERALAQRADHSAAFRSRCLALAGVGRCEEAVAALQRAPGADAGDPETLNTLGYVLTMSGQCQEALAVLDRVLAGAPGHLGALVNRGHALLGLKSWGEALACLDRALELEPRHLDALVDRGITLLHLERTAEALECLDQALSIDSGHLNAHEFRGLALDRLRRPEQALSDFDQVLAAQPERASALRGRAIVLLHLKRHTEAAAIAQRLLARDPEDLAALDVQGHSLILAKRPGEALACCERALELEPGRVLALIHRGVALVELERLQEGLLSLERALSIAPENLDALESKGVALEHLMRREEARVCFDRVVAADPERTKSRYYRGMVSLALGHFEQGFADAECRWGMPGLAPHRVVTPAPQWLGTESLAGKTIFLHGEQGFGDTLQFARYVPLVAQRGARIILGAPEPLHALLRTLPAEIAEFVHRGSWPAHDFHCPLMSLPLAFGTRLDSIPATVPYLHAEPQRVRAWRQRLGARTSPRVGLAWSGNPDFPIPGRNIPLELLRPLCGLPAEFVSLQKDVRETDRAALAAMPSIAPLGETLGDFTDTAALLENLDLLITVDTGVAHLAGALGKPVWILQRYAACWRWLEHRTDSPWYPSARLFRQRAPGDWPEVVEQLRLALAEFLAEQRLPGAGEQTAAASGQVPGTVAAGVAARRPGNELVGRGIALAAHGQFAEALSCYAEVPPGEAGGADALFNAAYALRQLGRYQEAQAALEQVLTLQPGNVGTLHGMGLTLCCLGRLDDALQRLDQALAADPRNCLALTARGFVLNRLERHTEALESFDRALAINADHVDALNNRGFSLLTLGRLAEALASLDQALALAPGNLGVLDNRGAVLDKLRRHDEALACYDRILAGDPGYLTARRDRALVLLAQGRLPEGFREFEVRWELEPYKQNRLKTAAPLWLGAEAVAGRRVLLHCEQGLGDSIQFARYAPLLAQRGAQVTLRVPAVLRELMQTLPGEVAVVTEAGPLPAHDLHCPLMSLPLAFGTSLETIPGQVPYLRSGAARSAAWAARLGPRRRPRIGLVWAGRWLPPAMPGRHMALGVLQPLLGLDAEFISLQQEVPESDRALLERLPLVRHGEALADFADTAALIDNLDLVISVDTAVAHLAGALGKPVWVMNRYAGCWRWMWDRSDSPWYPSLRLFRQPAPGDWTAVVEAVRQAAAQWLGAQAPAVLAAAPAAEAEVERWLQQGIAAAGGEDYATALERFTQVLQRQPRDRRALRNIGSVMLRIERHEEAAQCLEQALSLYPDDDEARFLLGQALSSLQRWDEALACFAAVPERSTHHRAALSGRGHVLNRLRRHEEALASFERALAVDPQDVDLRIDVGQTLMALERHTEALHHAEQILAIRPDDLDALDGRGAVLLRLDRIEEALECFNRVLDADPGHANARHNRGMALVYLGQLPEGFRDMEARWASQYKHLAPPSAAPLWLGEQPLQNKTILLYAEQGFGDTLQFVRYAPEVVKLGARVILGIPVCLRDILRSLSDQLEVVAYGELLPPHDFRCPLMSLPLAFGTRLETVPTETSYLHADPAQIAQWRQRLGLKTRPRIGLAWAGRQYCTINYARDMPLRCLLPLLELDAEFVSLQKEVPPGDRGLLESLAIFRQVESAEDFADTAALIENLDLVITVDTAVAHLAGALGRPVWVMNRHPGCWRWMRERDDSPWYPSLRLFRQPAPGDWAAVVAAVRQAATRWLRAQVVPAPVAAADAEAERWLQQGMAAAGREDYATALECFTQVLQRQPRDRRALRNIGSVMLRIERHEEAAQCLEQALSLDPDDDEARFLFGRALYSLQRWDQALGCFAAVPERSVHYRTALFHRCVALHCLGRAGEAGDWEARALALQPDDSGALLLLADELARRGAYQSALARYDRVLAATPDDVAALSGRGYALNRLHRHDQALAAFERALAIDPRHVDVHLNLTDSLMALGRDGEALHYAEQLLAARPDNLDMLDARGVVLGRLNRPEEALECFNRVLEADPDDAGVRYNRSMVLLYLGRLAEGFRDMEARWASQYKDARPPSAAPLWLGGQPVQGKTILLHAEQGLGDTLHFARYALDVLKLGVRVILGVPPPLRRLLCSLSGEIQVIADGDALPPHDFRCPLLSLPLAFGTRLETIPAETPYLRADPAQIAQWRRRLGPKTRPRIGLAWAGRQYGTINFARDIPLRLLLPLLEPDAEFVSLQKEVPPSDRGLLETLAIFREVESAEDFADTAALIENLDLVITVDTAVAHLAGALSRPVWLMNRFAPCWRWLRERSDSPWYPSLRLFRQPAPGDWAAVVVAVRQAVEHWLRAQAVLVPAPAPAAEAEVERWLQQGMEAAGGEDYAAALECFTQVLQRQPRDRRALRNTGWVMLRIGRHEEAAQCLEQALSLDPDDDEARFLFGRALYSLRRWDQALGCFAAVPERSVHYRAALFHGCVALHRLGRAAEAGGWEERALALQPDNGEALLLLAGELAQRGVYEPALARFDRVLAAAPDDVAALSGRGYALNILNRHEQALAAFERALAIDPRNLAVHLNLTDSLMALGRPAEALHYARQVLAMPSDDLKTLDARGTALQHLNCPEEALECFNRVLDADPNHAGARYSRGIVLLRLGRLAEGFRDFEARWVSEVKDVASPSAAPLWLGEQPLQGKTILLYAEQGFGDTLQFVRYAPEVVKLGAQVILRIPACLRGILRSLSDQLEVVAYGEPLPPHDFRCPLMSLPLAFGTRLETIPAEIPYLRADPGQIAQWRQRLGAKTRPRIGLAWAGRQFGVINRVRDLSLRFLLPLLELDAEFVSLQKEVPQGDRSLLEILAICRQVESAEDFADTAALIENLDLVITVDTAVAHLAGALGKPVWMMNRHPGCWRWMRERNDSPWYPSLRLFRQPAESDWESVVRDVVGAATSWLADARRGSAAPTRASSAEVSAQAAAAISRGIAAAAQGDLAAALSCFTEALAVEPDQVQALDCRGRVLGQLGRLAESAACFERALALQADFADARSNLAAALNRLGRHQDALREAEQVLVAAPGRFGALLNRGVAAWHLDRYEAAHDSFTQALAVRPDDVEALVNCGGACSSLERHAEALDCFERALALRPREPRAMLNRGITLNKLNRPQDALACLQELLGFDPDNADAWHSRGAALAALNHLDQALTCYDEALRRNPRHWGALNHRSWIYLAQGNFAEGLRDYEYRWQVPPLRLRRLATAAPLWLGRESLEGRSILLHAEQGLGDTLQFMRYAPLVAECGARVILRLPLALHELAASLRGVVELLAESLPLPPHDYQCPLHSLPLAFGTRLESIPAEMPYLRADPARVAQWRQRLGAKTRPRIGLTWAGRQYGTINHPRDMSLHLLLPLLELDAEFVSLQKEVPQDDRALLPTLPISRHIEAAGDFADAAALVENLDLVITVDTAVAHLAGALGKPAWVMNRHAACWRWLLERSDSPWYPSLRLFRQRRHGDWNDVVQEVLAAARSLLAAGPPAPPAGDAASAAISAGQAEEAAAAEMAQGLALAGQGRHDQALRCFERALAAQPLLLPALHNRAAALAHLGLHAPALDSFEQALGVDSAHFGSLLGRAIALVNLERHQDAVTGFDAVLALQPDHADALCGKGFALTKLDRCAEGLACIDRALELRPGHADTLYRRGYALCWLDRLREALACFDAVLAADPGHADARRDRSMLWLAQGELVRGFAEYESRRRAGSGGAGGSTAPQWLGEASLRDESILLDAEQGFGDVLQFCRYAPLVARLAAKVFLRVPAPLATLMRTLPGPIEVLDEHAPLPPHDHYCPLLSLPLAFGTRLGTIPAEIPYLHAEPVRAAQWSTRLGKKIRPRIGLAWAGRQLAPLTQVRDVRLALLRPLLEMDADFVSLQREVPPADRALLERLPMARHGESLADFADAAALVDNLDLVIAVDTAVAHLAGAMGKPVLLLNRKASCWRWLRDRDDSPWYPSLRLFRQRALGDWSGVIAEVRQAAAEPFTAREGGKLAAAG